MIRGVWIALAVLTASTPAIAQTEVVRPRIETGSSIKLPSPIQTRVEAFFASLQAGQTTTAFQDLTRGSGIQERPGALETMTSRADTMLKTAGPIVDWKPSALIHGEYTITVSYVARTEKVPLNFNFAFYEPPSGAWKLTAVYFQGAAGSQASWTIYP